MVTATETQSHPLQRNTFKTPWKNELKDYVMIAIGTAFYGLGVTLFMLPYKLTTGGIAGVSSIIFYITGIEVQISYAIINIVFLMVAIYILGWRFCLKTIAGVAFSTFWMWAWQRLAEDSAGNLPMICGDQSFMSCVLGAMLGGFGLFICFTNHGSTGGTDIIAACINKYKDVSLGQIILACDVLIISSCYFVFHDIERVIFGYVMMGTCSVTLDYCMRRQHQAVKFEIFSRNYIGVADAINKAGFGVTVMDGEGWWTKSERKVVVCIASKRYYPIVAECIKRVDPYAFLTVTNISSVFGQGFSEMKTKVKGQKPILVYCTADKDKFNALSSALNEKYDVRSLKAIGCYDELPQTHNNLRENALQMAQYVKNFYGFNTIAEASDGEKTIIAMIKDGENYFFEKDEYEKSLEQLYKFLNK